jgi:hypothetical protein
MDSVRRKIFEARIRLAARDFAASVGVLFVGAVVLVFVVRFFQYLGKASSISLIGLSACILAAIVIMAAIWSFWRWRNAEAVACLVDRAAKTKDRLASALSFTGSSDIERSASREIDAFAANLDLAGIFRIRFPRIVTWALLPIALFVAIEFVSIPRASTRAPDTLAAESLLKSARDAAKEKSDSEIQKAAADLENARESLKDSANPMQDALAALADARARMAASMDQGLQPAEAEAIADGIETANAKLAEDLRAGRYADAAKEMALVDPAALEKALSDAARHLQNNRIQSLAQSSQSQSGLAKLLQSSPSRDAKSQRQKFLASLGDLGDSGKEAGDGSASKSPSQSSSKDEGASGSAGSEKDLGEGGKIKGTAAADKTEATKHDQLEGQIGEGPSEAKLIRFTGNQDARTTREFRQAFPGVQAAAIDAVDRENVPPGSRLMVRRYFESIRPAE